MVTLTLRYPIFRWVFFGNRVSHAACAEMIFERDTIHKGTTIHRRTFFSASQNKNREKKEKGLNRASLRKKRTASRGSDQCEPRCCEPGALTLFHSKPDVGIDYLPHLAALFFGFGLYRLYGALFRDTSFFFFFYV